MTALLRMQVYGHDLGIRAEGRDADVTFRSLEEASGNARLLVQKGYGTVVAFTKASSRLRIILKKGGSMPDPREMGCRAAATATPQRTPRARRR